MLLSLLLRGSTITFECLFKRECELEFMLVGASMCRVAGEFGVSVELEKAWGGVLVGSRSRNWECEWGTGSRRRGSALLLLLVSWRGCEVLQLLARSGRKCE